MSSQYSSSDNDSESPSEDDHLAIAKPVFIPRGQRAVIQERTEKEIAVQEGQRLREEEIRLAQATEREQALARAAEEEDNQLKLGAHELVNKAGEPTLNAPPIGDEDTPDEYQRWKLRELRRVLAFRKTGCFVHEDEE